MTDSFDSDPGRTPSNLDHPPGDTFSHTFNTPGTFSYICKVHSFMTGKVIVNGPAIDLIRVGADTVRAVVKKGRVVAQSPAAAASVRAEAVDFGQPPARLV